MTRSFLVCSLMVIVYVVFCEASAMEPDERLKDPVLEARARAIGAELRCLVCQNQSVDDSSSAFAKDVRLLLRDRLQAGDSDEEIRYFLVERFGEFILLRPSLKGTNLFLWLFPVGVLVFASILVWCYYHRRRTDSVD